MEIRAFQAADTERVVALWLACDLVRPWNDPRRDIERKLALRPDQFLVGEIAGQVIATAMCGYDGHRGWIYYFAVHPNHQRQGLASRMMAEVERILLAEGCPKINLQVRTSNTGVLAFYRKLGFEDNDVLSMGKRLIPD